MEIKKEDYSCMHGYDKDQIYKSEVESSEGLMYGHIYVDHKTSFITGHSIDSKFTRLKKCFGKISEMAKTDAQYWCKIWLPMVQAYCTHKDHEFEKKGYGMSINVSPHGYAYYSIIKFSEGKRGLYPAVSSYLYQPFTRKWKFFKIDQELTIKALKQCYKDALADWQLITQ